MSSGLAARSFAGFADGLDPVALEAVRAAGRVQRVAKGTTLFCAGDEGTEVFVILAGMAKVTTWAPNGREVVLDVVEAGALLGELSVIDGGPRTATVVALDAVEVLAVTAARFRALLADHPTLNAALLDLLAARVRVATERQVELGANDALGRVCRLLIDLDERYGNDAAPGGGFVVPLSQQDLASWAGLSRDAFVKALRAVRVLGWARLDGRRAVLCERSALERRAVG